MKMKKTERGFRIAEFEDRYGSECSIQESSIATEDCIWLGPNSPNPQRMIEGKNGWHPVELPEGTSCTTRMHLTREQVSDLLPFLQHFVKTGYLPEVEEGGEFSLEQRKRLFEAFHTLTNWTRMSLLRSADLVTFYKQLGPKLSARQKFDQVLAKAERNGKLQKFITYLL